MIRSSIDLGTNTCLLLVGEVPSDGGGVQSILHDQSTIVRLGQKVDQTRMLQTEAMERTIACLREYAVVLEKWKIDPAETVCVATSQARDARNGEKFFKRIQAETGFRFQVLTGEEEARASFMGGLLPGMSPDQSAIIDIGGGSTEFMSRSSGMSLDMGSVRFTERFLHTDPVSDPEFWSCQDAIDSLLLQPRIQTWRKSLPKECHLVGVAGTITSLGAWHLGLERYERESLDRLILTRGDVHRMVEELKWRTVQERRQLAGMEAMRADVILAGALILWRSMELLDFLECRVSTRGLRFGVLHSQ